MTEKTTKNGKAKPPASLPDVHQLLQEFAASYLNTSKGAAHLRAHERSREDGRRNLSEILQASERGEDVTELVLAKLLPHKDTPFNRERGAWVHIAPAVTRDLKKWFENIGWTAPGQWPEVAAAIFRFVRQVREDPQRLDAACREFAALPVSKGLQSAFLSPALNAIDPDRFLIVNKKSLESLRFLVDARYHRAIIEYPEANGRLLALLEGLGGDLVEIVPAGARFADVLDAFCHWLVAIRKVTRPARKETSSKTTKLDRDAPDFPKSWFERAFPDSQLRANCAGFLADAIEESHRQGQACWEVAIRGNGARLVVGFRRVLELRANQIRLSVSDADTSRSRQALETVGTVRKRVTTKPASVVYGLDPQGFSERREDLWPAMRASIEQEAKAIRWRTPFYQAHAPGVVDYLSASLNRELPVPRYEKDDSGKLKKVPAVVKTSRFVGPGTLFNGVDYNLEKLLSDIDMGDIGLPDLQRPFVWSTTKVRDLFDSMYRGFPVGYLLFWSNSQLKGTQIGVGEKAHRIPNHLVVDGQQRLTSLFSVVKGRTVRDSDFNERTIEIAFRPRDSRFEVADAAIRNDPEFIPNISVLWTSGKSPLGLMNDFLKTLESKKPLNEGDREAISHNLGRLFNLPKFPFSALEISAKVDEEAVADIFVRINSEGVQLKQADFILTLLSVFWPEGRDELERFARESRKPPSPSSGPSSFNYLIELAPDRLLRVVMAFGFRRARLRNAYMVLRGKDVDTGEFSPELRKIQFTQLREAQAQVLELKHWHLFLNCLKSAGFRSKDMISSEIAVLYSYVFYLVGRLQCGVDEQPLERLISRWFFAIALTGRYTGASETVMDEDLVRVKNVREPEGFVEILERMLSAVLTKDFWEITLPANLETSSPRSPAMFAFYAAQCRLGAPVLFSDKTVVDLLDPSLQSVKKSMEKHHLFPRKWLEMNGVSGPRSINQVGNFSLVEWPENISIGATAPSQYVPKIRERFDRPSWDRMQGLHALPDGWEDLAYEEFLERRRPLMADHIRRGFESLGAKADGVQHEADGSQQEQEVWASIRNLEMRLRTVVRERFNAQWRGKADQRIRSVLGEQAWDGIERNRGKYLRQYPMSSDTADSEDILKFCYFGQLAQLMMSGEGWALFRPPFKDKRQLEDLVASIIPVRNDGAHFRPVPKNELLRCSVALSDLETLLAQLPSVDGEGPP